MKIGEVLLQLFGAIILVVILYQVLQAIDFGVAIGSFFVLLAIAVIVLWLLKEFKILR
jgi:hypothetical protein